MYFKEKYFKKQQHAGILWQISNNIYYLKKCAFKNGTFLRKKSSLTFTPNSLEGTHWEHWKTPKLLDPGARWTTPLVWLVDSVQQLTYLSGCPPLFARRDLAFSFSFCRYTPLLLLLLPPKFNKLSHYFKITTYFTNCRVGVS